MLETVERIFEATHATVDSMNDGERLQLKELAQTVGLAVAMEPKHVLGFVNHFVHNSDIAYVTRGKNGGVIKGVKTAKPAKPAKLAKSTTSKTVSVARDPSIALVEPTEDSED